MPNSEIEVLSATEWKNLLDSNREPSRTVRIVSIPNMNGVGRKVVAQIETGGKPSSWEPFLQPIHSCGSVLKSLFSAGFVFGRDKAIAAERARFVALIDATKALGSQPDLEQLKADVQSGSKAVDPVIQPFRW